MFDFSTISGPEGSRQGNFASLCTCLLMRVCPEAKAVEGKGGDEGVDAFIGDFDGSLQVFQYKYFLEPLKTAQKRQVKHSLEQAARYHHPSSWTLVLPKDLSPAEQRWFTSLGNDSPGIQMDWWGKTKLIELLVGCPDLAAAFQPAKPLTLLVLGKDFSRPDPTLSELVGTLSRLGYSVPAEIAPGVQKKLSPAAYRPKLRVLLWGPGVAGGPIHAKRIEIRDRLAALGHVAKFSEDLVSPTHLAAGGLNLTIEEYLQARAFDYIICLMASPGTIGEVHDFAKRRDLACKMMVCVDLAGQSGYSAGGVLRIFEGLNGKLDWFRNPQDLTDCNLATRVLQQVEKTVEAKHWELLERELPL